jgi:hypothetical protein
MLKKTFVILTNSKLDQMGFGDYLRIISILKNFKFDRYIWISDNEIHSLISHCDVIDLILKLNTEQSQGEVDNADFVLNLFENKISNKKILYVKNILNQKFNIKKSGQDMCQQICNYFNLKNYKLFHNNHQVSHHKYDIFINHVVPLEWKIKEYPFNRLKKIEKFINGYNKNLKILWQNDNDSISNYINNIKDSKIILSIIGLGTHIGMLFNKRMIVLAGPTFFNDLDKYHNKKVIFPNIMCECQTTFLNLGIACNFHKGVNNSCMNDISEDRVYKTLINELAQ